MNKLRTSWIIWGIVMFAIVTLLFCFGLIFTNKNKVYKEQESKLVETTKMYVESSTWYPKAGESLKVDINELIENGLIENVVVNDDSCKGYIKVINNGIIEYKAYLKCKNYKTHGYE